MFGLPLDTWIRLGVWLLIGLVIYARLWQTPQPAAASGEGGAGL